jgi:NitT/TauT family transport system substrate-binding protein
MMATRRILGPIRLAALVIAVALSPVWLPSVADAQAVQVLNVGTIPLDANGPLYYAQQLGYFKDVGLDVHITPMNSGPTVAAAVVSGALDVGVANVATIAQAHNRGLPFNFIAPGALATPTSMTNVIMVAKDSPIRTAADLNGKTIAINALKDLQQISVQSWIDKHGGDSKTIKFVEVPVSQMAGAVVAHRVDAAKGDEPFITEAKSDVRVIGNAEDGIAPRFMIIGWFSTEQWIKDHPDLAARFAAAIGRASLWANTHDRESLAIFLQTAKLDPQMAASMARSRFGAALDPAMMQPVLDTALKYGVLDRPISASDLIWRAP